jgi:hypothetical protein
MQPPTTTPSDVHALMPFIMPLITQFLSEVSKAPPRGANAAHRQGAGRNARGRPVAMPLPLSTTRLSR